MILWSRASPSRAARNTTTKQVTASLVSRFFATTPTRSKASAAPTANMATAYKIRVPANDTGLLKFKQSDETANKVSELLQKDLETHHVFFNLEGFHNHQGYDANASYQLPANRTRPAIADALASDWTSEAPKHIGSGPRYPDFLLFFQRQLDSAASAAGGDPAAAIEAVLSEFLFNRGDPRAEDLLQRMLAGFLHPLIQLMYGVEWAQPAIVAEALAQAAVHKNQLKEFLETAENEADGNATPMPTMRELYESLHADSRFQGSVQIKDGNKVYDGVLKRAPEVMMEYARRVRVREDEVDERTAEMFESAIWSTAGAALRPGKQAKFDFFLIHQVNSAPIFVTLNKQPWISAADKARILEWKLRMDLVQYAARALPPIRFGDVASYKPDDVDRGVELVEKSQDLFPRFHAILDDGHTIKLVRALDICRELLEPYGDRPWRLIKGDDTWLKLHYMVLDSSEHGPEGMGRWIRSAGFDELWEEIPDRK